MGITFGNNEERPSSWKEMSYEQVSKVRDEFITCDNITDCAIYVLRKAFPDHVFDVARYGEWIAVDGNKITLWAWGWTQNRENAWNKISCLLADIESAWM